MSANLLKQKQLNYIPKPGGQLRPKYPVNGITIISRSNGNGDGLDFDGCTNVRVVNSSFDNSDDSICLQASLPDKPCRDIVISNCIFTTRWGGMRIGLLSMG